MAGLIEMRRKDVTVASERDAENAIRAAGDFGARIMLAGDPDYPARLAHSARPPIMLYAMGDAERIDGPTVAIVGARNASTAAKRFARELAEGLSAAGVAVVSGLARGIDGAAHQGSLAGYPVGVVAGGIDVVYPPEHRELQAAIADKGLLVAESPMGAKPTERHFPRRNRIVAGLAQAVVVVEAAERSGSLITARFAMEEGREVMAAPGFPTDPRAAGANRLIRDGALLIRGADDVLAGLPPPDAPVRPRAAVSAAARAFPPESPAETLPNEADIAPSDPMQRVRIALSAAPVTIDELTRECQLSVAAVASILQELELGGELERLPGQRVTLR